jgi:hypothetical protein
MKFLHVAILFLLSFVHSHAQGELFFSTRNPAGNVNAPTWVLTAPLGPLVPAGPVCSAQIYIVNGQFGRTAVPGSLTTYQFPGPGGAAILDRYVNPVTVQFSGVPIGNPVTIVIRAWYTAAGSYEAAQATGYAAGESPQLFIPALGGGVNPPADLPSVFTGFTIFGIVPEPSTWALIALGFLGFSFCRYKSKIA